jgi:tetratricopeptide (TPR) repeat protein
MRLRILSLVLLLVGVTPALADRPLAPVGALLAQSASPPELRARLLAYADSAAAAGRAGRAADARRYAGQSFQREGRVDSAIVCYRLALGSSDEARSLLALTDQLLLRRGPGDIAEALRRLDAARENAEAAALPQLLGRLAWGRFQQGELDTAAALFAAAGPGLQSQPEWRYRSARLALERKDYRRTIDLLLPEAVRTRGTDDEVVGLLESAGDAVGMTKRLQAEVRRQVENRDRPNVELARQLGGRLVALRASDGFTLGGLLVPAPGAAARRPPLLAVVLLSPADTLAAADSLVAALRGHGLATLLLHPRGSGTSVGPSCPSPDAWFDREAALQARVARDVVETARWARSVTPVDTTRYVIAGVAASVTMAVEAATLDPRAAALLLVSPAPVLVDWGATGARLARRQVPVFFQIAAEDFDVSAPITDALYQAGNRAASRVVESRTPGSGLAQFRDDPQLAARFLAWLDATLRPSGRTRTR